MKDEFQTAIEAYSAKELGRKMLLGILARNLDPASVTKQKKLVEDAGLLNRFTEYLRSLTRETVWISNAWPEPITMSEENWKARERWLAPAYGELGTTFFVSSERNRTWLPNDDWGPSLGLNEICVSRRLPKAKLPLPQPAPFSQFSSHAPKGRELLNPLPSLPNASEYGQVVEPLVRTRS